MGGRKLGVVHDVLLWYAVGKGHTYNKVYGAHNPEYVKKFYRYEDEHGRYQTGDLTAMGIRNGDSGQPWRGIDPSTKGNHWRAPGEFSWACGATCGVGFYENAGQIGFSSMPMALFIGRKRRGAFRDLSGI